MKTERVVFSCILARALVCILACAVASSAACVEKSRGLTAAEREQIRPLVSTTAPTPSHPLDIAFEDKVRLVGYDVSPASWRPGQRAHVTLYWKSDKRLDGSWKLFTHVSNGPNPMAQNVDHESAVRRLYQPDRWKDGEYIKDELDFALAADWSSAQAVLYVGMFRDSVRLRIVRGPSDGDNRARVVTVPVEGARAGQEASPLPSLVARQLASGVTVTLDGKLDEPAWAETPTTGPLVHSMTGEVTDPRTTVKVLWDEGNLYVGFDVADTHLRSTFQSHDDHLWDQDCVEVMIDPAGDEKNYFEMQVSPANVSFDTRYDTPRQPQPFGDIAWTSLLRSAVELRGTLNDDRSDQGYSVEMAIPWTAFAAGDPPAARPTPGDQWRINFFVLDTTSPEGGQRAVSWSPPRLPDFHTLNRFGRIRFASASPERGAKAPRLTLPPAALEQIAKRASAYPERTEPLRPAVRPGETVPTRENPRPE